MKTCVTHEFLLTGVDDTPTSSSAMVIGILKHHVFPMGLIWEAMEV